MADSDARQRAKTIASSRGLGGLANDTKWREFFALVMKNPFSLEVKVLHEEAAFYNARVWIPAPGYIEGSGMGPELFVSIEWVRSQAIGEVQAAALAVGLECEIHEGKAMVLGYR